MVCITLGASCDEGKYHSKACNIFLYGNNRLGGPLQVFAVYLQLMIIVGLCLDSGKAWTTRFFKTRIMQFLGRISMALYLIHFLLIDLLKLIIYGPYEWVDGKAPNVRLPVWGIPIHLGISLISGIILTLFIEDPARNFLKSYLAKRQEKIETQKGNTKDF